MAQAICPICKRSLAAGVQRDEANGAFPFCSTRCKLVDLGAWLDGSYRIPGEPLSDDPSDELLSKLTSHDGGDA
ncbi:MAG: DNA gyrase inhibitor YacG [Sandaracinaceae bacterium]|nr:DNA gyrase inhibitor YacG [Sandaracinaceae bacterium]